MARFDPPVQDTEGSAGEFLRWSHPISPIPPNESKAKAFEGATTAFEAGVKGLNKTAEEVATKIGINAGEEEQGKFGTAVSTVHEQLFPGDKSTNPDTLTPGSPAVPAGISQGMKGIQSNQAAYDQGG